VEAGLQPVAGCDNVAESQAHYESGLKAEIEEAEMAHLEAKLLKNGKLTMKKGGDTSFSLYGGQTSQGEAGCRILDASAPGAGSDQAPADAVPMVDPPAIDEATPTEVVNLETDQVVNPEEISLREIDEYLVEEVLVSDTKEAPAREDDWYLCISEGRETDTKGGLRAEHILKNGWLDCRSYRLFVDRLHQQLAA
jgi:hypothetical protein